MTEILKKFPTDLSNASYNATTFLTASIIDGTFCKGER